MALSIRGCRSQSLDWPGGYPDISLQRARQKAQECRQQLYEGIDPLKRKRDQRAALSRQAGKQAPTFAECAAAYFADSAVPGPTPTQQRLGS